MDGKAKQDWKQLTDDVQLVCYLCDFTVHTHQYQCDDEDNIRPKQWKKCLSTLASPDCAGIWSVRCTDCLRKYTFCLRYSCVHNSLAVSR